MGALAAAFMFVSIAGAAGQIVEVEPFVFSRTSFDDNFLRTANSAEAVAISGDSDPSEFIFGNGGGASAVARLGRQRLRLDFQVVDNRYLRNDRLDNIEYSVTPAWDWRVGDICDGRLSYEDSRSLASFADFEQLVKNMQRRIRFAADGGCYVDPNVRLVTTLSRFELRNEAEVREDADRIAQQLEGGVEYVGRGDNALGLRFRVGDLRYPNRDKSAASASDNRFTDYDAFVFARWEVSSKTALRGSAGVTVRKAEEFDERDFTEPFGRLQVEYSPTSKVDLRIVYLRDVIPSDDLVATFRVRDEVAVDAAWQVRPKFSLAVSGATRWDSFLGDPTGGIGSDLADRADRTVDAGLSLRYEPLEGLRVSMGARLLSRKSNEAEREFDSSSVFASVRFSL